MQPKVDLSKKQELVAKMISEDISAMEKKRYVRMCWRVFQSFLSLLMRRSGDSKVKTCV